MSDELAIGLRFDRRDALRLLHIGQRMQAEGLQREDITLFALAAKAANDGEPLVVHCTTPDEAQRMADAFVVHGISRPAVEDLGSRETLTR